MGGLNVHSSDLDKRINDLLGRDPQALGNLLRALVLLVGTDTIERKVLRTAESGILAVTSGRIVDVFHVTATGDNDTYQGGNIPTTEVLVMGHPDNAGKVWVKPFKTATTANAWPLEAKDALPVTINNLKDLNLLIASDTEKAIVLYTR